MTGQDEGDDRRHREGERRGIGGRLVVVVEPLLDEQRRGLRLADDPPGYHRHGTELADAPGQAEYDAVADGRADRGQRDPAKGLEARRTKGSGRLLLLGADLLKHRGDSADD